MNDGESLRLGNGLNGSTSTAQLYVGMVAATAWFGVALQCYLSLTLARENGLSVARGFIILLGFFTVLTNILVSVALTFPLLARRSAPGRFFARPFAVAGIAANIAFVALSYHFLLRKTWNPQGPQLLADVLLHYVTPVLFIVYWFVFSRSGSLRWVFPLWWSLYPAVYFVYALVRGELIGSYPYAFIDVSAIGYRHTVMNAFALLLAFVLLGSLFVGLDRSVGRVGVSPS